MSEPTAQDVGALTDVLGEHWLAFRDGKDPYYCPCGEWVAVIAADGRDQSGVTIEVQHLAHLATVVSGWYVERIAEARRDGAAMALNEAAGAFMVDLSNEVRRWLRHRAAALTEPTP